MKHGEAIAAIFSLEKKERKNGHIYYLGLASAQAAAAITDLLLPLLLKRACGGDVVAGEARRGGIALISSIWVVMR